MEFPQTNKQKKFKEKFGENAKLLEDRLKDLNLRIWLKSWGIGLAILCVTIFSVLFTIEIALNIIR